MPEEDMGKGNISGGGGSLTEKDFRVLAEKWGMRDIDAKKNVFQLLKKQLTEKNENV